MRPRSASCTGCCATSAARSWRTAARRAVGDARRGDRGRPRAGPGVLARRTWTARSRSWPTPRASAASGPGRPGRRRRASAGAADGPHGRQRELEPGRPRAESESTSLAHGGRVRGRAGRGHEIQAGSGYGSRWLFRSRATSDATAASTTAAWARSSSQDRWQARRNAPGYTRGRPLLLHRLPGATATTSTPRPRVELEARRAHAPARRVRQRGPCPPGGDLLTLSDARSAPAMAFAVVDDGLRAERAHALRAGDGPGPGRGHGQRAHVLRDVDDQLVNAFSGPAARARCASSTRGEPERPRHGRHGRPPLRRRRPRLGQLHLRPQLARKAGRRRTRRADAAPTLRVREADFHDLVARLETCIDWTDTRVVAFYRLNTPDARGRGARHRRPTLANTRFDVQLSQGLPFLGALTRADWEFLLAVRNLFYETTEGAIAGRGGRHEPAQAGAGRDLGPVLSSRTA